MPDSNPAVDVVVVVDPHSGATRVCFESPVADADRASELWWDPHSPNYFLYHPDEFYDTGLRHRRNANLMFSPISPYHKLVFVGLVWGAPTYSKQMAVISRSKFRTGDGPQ